MFERKMMLFCCLSVLLGGMQITEPAPKQACEPQACVEALTPSGAYSGGIKLFSLPIEGKSLVIQFATLSTTINDVLRKSDVREHLATLGFETRTGTPAEFDVYLREEVVKWGKLLKQTSIAPQ